MAYFANSGVGDAYEAKYCAYCALGSAQAGRPVDGYVCPVMALHLSWNYTQHRSQLEKGALETFIPTTRDENLACLCWTPRHEHIEHPDGPDWFAAMMAKLEASYGQASRLRVQIDGDASGFTAKLDQAIPLNEALATLSALSHAPRVRAMANVASKRQDVAARAKGDGVFCLKLGAIAGKTWPAMPADARQCWITGPAMDSYAVGVLPHVADAQAAQDFIRSMSAGPPGPGQELEVVPLAFYGPLDPRFTARLGYGERSATLVINLVTS